MAKKNGKKKAAAEPKELYLVIRDADSAFVSLCKSMDEVNDDVKEDTLDYGQDPDYTIYVITSAISITTTLDEVKVGDPKPTKLKWQPVENWRW